MQYAEVPAGGSLAVFGLGPIGQMCCRVARQRGVEQVIGVDLVPERLELARQFGAETIDFSQIDAVPAAIREMTGGRGTDAVIDAVGMEAHGGAGAAAKVSQLMANFLPDPAARKLVEKAAVDRLDALLDAIASVRRGGTLSISGVYGGAVDPLPMMELFDKGLQIRMGQAHVRRWIPEILPLLEAAGDPLGVETLATHHLTLDEAPEAYRIFQAKENGAIKVVLHP